LEQAVRSHRVVGAVAGVSDRGDRTVAAAGLADVDTRRELTPDTVLRAASLTKTMVAAAVVLATRDDVGALDRPILEWLPAARRSWRASPRLTLRHVLSHTSGLPRHDPAVLRKVGEGDDALAAAVAVVGAHGQAFRPGSAWEYCNPGYWLAGAVLAAVRGRPFEDALREVLLDPAGMGRTGFVLPADGARGHRAGSVVVAAYERPRRPSGGVCTTAADVLSFAEFLLADPDLLARLGTPVAWSLFGARYGLGLNISGARACRAPINSGGMLFHDGDLDGYKARLVLAPAQRYAAVVLANDAAAGPVIDEVLGAELGRATGAGPPWRRPSRVPVMAYAMARLGLARALGLAGRR
jgi:CubicO group peptidase (beta-lactamase class C family)